jgi:abequosyltransferase
MLILSICIPTYNRSFYLGQLLNELFLQLNDFRDEVEICVSDNGSNDDTIEILESWKCKFENFKYSSNNSNLGPDLNYQKVVELSAGKFVWFFGSDDLPEVGAIESLLSILRIKANLGILIFNRNDYDIHMNFIDSRFWLSEDIKNFEFLLADEISFIKYLDCSKSLGAIFSYLSSIVFLREIWVCKDNVTEFNNSAYSHAFILLNAFLEDNNSNFIFLYCANQFVKNRTNNDSFLTTPKKRLLLDYKGYRKIASKLGLSGQLGNSFIKVLSREHPYNVLINSLSFYRLNKVEFKLITENIYSDEEIRRLNILHKFRALFIFFVGIRLFSQKYLKKKTLE